MNQTQLRLFVAAAESRSFTKTAEQFFITQDGFQIGDGL